MSDACKACGFGVAIFAGVLLFPRFVVAQETAAVERLRSMTLEELLAVRVATVSSTSRSPELTPRAPATVIVIDRRTIRLRGYSTLADLLRDLPGMEVTPYYFSEIGTQVAVRGIAGNNKIVLLVNGMRINPPGGEFYPLRADLSVRDAEQVEVSYGPGSTLYGQDAVSLVVNIVTRAAERPGAVVGGGFGTEREREGWASFSWDVPGSEDARIAGYVQARDSDLTRIDRKYPAWWAPYAERARENGAGDPPRREDYGLNALVRFETSTAYIQGFARESRRSSAEGFNPILGYVDEATWEDRSIVVEAGLAQEVSERLTLESMLHASRYEIDPASRYVFPAASGGWFLDDYKYGIGRGITFEQRARIEAGETLRLLLGVMAGDYGIRPKSTVPGGADAGRDISSQAGAFAYQTDPSDPATRVLIPRSMRAGYQTVAAFGEAAWQACSAWRLILGTRWTWDSRFDSTPFTPRAALVYQPTAQWTVKYIVTRAFLAPGPYFRDATFDNGTILNTSNPDLGPEKALTHEVNAVYRTGTMRVGASVYAGEQKNLLLVSDSRAPRTVVLDRVYLPDGSTRVLGRTVNGGDSESFGVDLYGMRNWRRVSAWGSYSYVDYEEDNGGVEMGLRGLSEHQGRAGVTIALTDRLFVTPSVTVRSTPRNVRPGALESELDTPWEARLHALYEVTRDVDAFLTVRNLTDERLALGGFTGDAVPQETFSAIAGVQVRF